MFSRQQEKSKRKQNQKENNLDCLNSSRNLSISLRKGINLHQQFPFVWLSCLLPSPSPFHTSHILFWLPTWEPTIYTLHRCHCRKTHSTFVSQSPLQLQFKELWKKYWVCFFLVIWQSSEAWYMTQKPSSKCQVTQPILISCTSSVTTKV